MQEKIREVTRWLEKMNNTLQKVNCSVVWKFNKSVENGVRYEVWLTFKFFYGGQTSTMHIIQPVSKENLRNLIIDFCDVVERPISTQFYITKQFYITNEAGYMTIKFIRPYAHITIFFNDCKNLSVYINSNTVSSHFDVKAEDVFDALLNTLLLINETEGNDE
jgi:hypothetical protein